MATTPSYILRLTRAAFRQEAEDLLAEFDTCLLQLEASPTERPLMDRAFRAIHTLKGSGATAGFREVSHVLHDMEELFNKAREGRIAITSAVVDRVLPITDLVKRMLVANEADTPSLLEEGERLLSAMKSLWAAEPPPSDEVPGARSAGAVRPASSVWRIQFQPQRGFFKTGNDPLVYLRELYAQGPSRGKALTSSLGDLVDFDPEDCYLAWEVQVASEASEQALREIFAFVEDAAEIRIQCLDSRAAWSLPAEAYFAPSTLADFLEECAEDISEVEGLVLALEEGTDRAPRITEMRRYLHNLKGVSRLVLSDAKREPPPTHPLRALGDLCHAAEDALSRDEFVRAEGGGFQTLFDLVDAMRTLSQALVSGEDSHWPRELLARLSGEPSPIALPPLPPSTTESVVMEVARQYREVVSTIIEEHAGEEWAATEELKAFSRILQTLRRAAESEGASALTVQVTAAATVCGDETTSPTWEQVREHVRRIDAQIAAYQAPPVPSSQPPLPERSSQRPRGRAVSLRPGTSSARPRPSEAATIARDSAATEATAQKPQSKTQGVEPPRSIRVDQAKLDRLMQAISELLVAKNALPVLAQKAESRETASVGREIKELGLRIGHIADDLQDAMRQVRMLPIRTVFQKFPRMIRDLAHSLGKHLQLIMSGEEVELDKTVLEQIGDPLVHLLRNAVDHGIESPEDRARRGKNDTGTIGIEVLAEGTHVVIRVSDDGQGMDPVRLRRKALEKGLLTPGAAEALSDQQAFDLIFLPGFTTAETVTAVSGRGVGMDVVCNSVRALRGTIEISSELGSGSVFTIRLPSSVMVSKGMLVEAAEDQYVLPIEGVREMVKIRASQIRMLRNHALAVVRGEVCRVVSMAGLLNGRGDEALPWAFVEANAVLVGGARGTLAVVVDRLIAEVDVIAKPLSEGYDRKHIFRGATILGDGRVALVIEPASLAQLVFDSAEQHAIEESDGGRDRASANTPLEHAFQGSPPASHMG